MAPASGSPPQPWSSTEKFAFRYAVLFFRWHLIIWIAGILPSTVSGTVTRTMRLLNPDTSPAWFKGLWPPCPGCQYNVMFWQQEFPWAALTALAGAIVWRLLDRDKVDYRRAYAFWRVVLRYAFGTSMIGWGFFKITGSQFWGLHADAFLIVRPLGEWASRSLMWNTMGQSVVYGEFTGVAEILGGTMLLFRRTTLIGALVLFFVNGTIFLLDALMNKGGITGPALWGTLLAAAFIIADWKRLRAFYVRNEPLMPAAEPRVIPGKLGLALKLVILYIMLKGRTLDGVQALFSSEKRAQHGSRNVPHHMTGAFKVESMTRNGQPVAPLHDDTTQWAFVGFGGGVQTTNMRGGRRPPTEMYIIRPDGAIREGYAFTLDSVKRTMTVDTSVRAKSQQGMQFDTWAGRVEHPSIFTYDWIDIDRMNVTAIISGDTIVANLRRAQVWETTLFGSPRLVKHNYGTPIKWPREDSIRLTAR